MVGVKHEHASAGRDGALARREQRPMLFVVQDQKKIMHVHTCTHNIYIYIYSFIHSFREIKNGWGRWR